MATWKLSEIEVIRTTLGGYKQGQMHLALKKLSTTFGREVTETLLNNILSKRGMGLARTLCLPDDLPDDLAKLLKLTKRPLSFGDLCDKLDKPPSKVRKLLDEAKAKGVRVHVENDHVGLAPVWYEEKVNDLVIPGVVGEVQRVAVISDTHLGSKYCLRAALQDFVKSAYAQGIREILHPGDVLDGMYKHGVWEVSHMGMEAQIQDLFETLPQLPGLTYHCITGNHDFTFTESTGLDVGAHIERYFKARGREDVKFYGDRGAFLRIRGAVVHLWHPRANSSYARSYQLQKHIEKYNSAEKPHILLAGHWHVYCHVYEREVHAVACPTFQGGGSAFSKSLGGSPAIGGLILSWQLSKKGSLRSFGVEVRAYPEKELVQSVRSA